MFSAPAAAVPLPPSATAPPVSVPAGTPTPMHQQAFAAKSPEKAHRPEDRVSRSRRRRRKLDEELAEMEEAEDQEEPSFRFFLPINTPFLAQFLAQVVIPARRRLTLVKKAAALYRKAYGLSSLPVEDEEETAETPRKRRDPIAAAVSRFARRRDKEALPPPFVAPPVSVAAPGLDAPAVVSG